MFSIFLFRFFFCKFTSSTKLYVRISIQSFKRSVLLNLVLSTVRYFQVRIKYNCSTVPYGTNTITYLSIPYRLKNLLDFFFKVLVVPYGTVKFYSKVPVKNDQLTGLRKLQTKVLTILFLLLEYLKKLYIR